MDDLIDEIKQDLHEEKINNAILKYGKYVILIIIILVIYLGISSYIDNKNQIENARISGIILKAINEKNEGKLEKAKASLENLLASNSSNLSDVININLAHINMSLQKQDEAIKIYKNLSKKHNLDLISELAILNLYGLTQENINEMKNLAQCKNCAFNKIANLMLYIDASEQGDNILTENYRKNLLVHNISPSKSNYLSKITNEIIGNNYEK